MSDKKSFVLYFDSFPLLALLPAEQRGQLISAVFQFAMGAAQSPPVSQEDILAQFPELSPEARMSFRSLAAAISRDTRTWQRKKEARMRRGGRETEEKAADGCAWTRPYTLRERQGAGPDDAWNYV